VLDVRSIHDNTIRAHDMGVLTFDELVAYALSRKVDRAIFVFLIVL
jgi:hypothetical protein